VVPEFSGGGDPGLSGRVGQTPSPGPAPNPSSETPTPPSPQNPALTNPEQPIGDDIELDPALPVDGETSTPVEELPAGPVTEAPPGEQPGQVPANDAFRPTRGTPNLFTEVLGIPVAEVDDKVRLAVNRVFGIGTNESAVPQRDTGYRLYYELPQDQSMAFIWAPDSNDVRSEGMSYGMMIAVQMDMQAQFDNLWRFAERFMQFTPTSSVTAWRNYFSWQGTVNTANGANWPVSFGGNGNDDGRAGPAPDGDEYFAAALFLADRRWGSGGAINYQAEAEAIARAMLNNQPGAGGRTPIIDANSNMVVFFPQGGAAAFSDPSYHLPAFYELFASDGAAADADRWRQVAEVSRQYFVTSANPQTGLHPDYANFNGTPNTGGQGQTHDQFRFDAWRVIMNMAVDYAWTGEDARLEAQIEKYHAFFGTRLGNNNVTNALFTLDGATASGGGSTALTATLASGVGASDANNRAEFVDNLWNVPQQTGQFRYYQETVYLLGLLSSAGLFGYDWTASP
jgi:oligosaccharide reducing-end xylanase